MRLALLIALVAVIILVAHRRQDWVVAFVGAVGIVAGILVDDLLKEYS